MPWLLLLACTSHLMLRTGGPMAAAQMDRGSIDYQLVGDRAIQRFDESSGKTTTLFTLDDPRQLWSVDDGTLAVRISTTQLLLVAPDGTRRLAEEPASVRGLVVHGGDLYWIEAGGDLRRRPLSGGPAETLVIGRAADPNFTYVVFEDRIVFLDANGLEWQPLGGGAPVLLLPQTNLAIDSVTRDAVFVSTKSPWDPNVSTARILRVPWSGAPAETVYEKSVQGYVPDESVGAMVRGQTIWLSESLTEHFFWTTSKLFVLRDGVARLRFSAPNAPFTILAAGEDDVVLGYWDGAGGMRQIARVCADDGKMRAAARR